MTRAEAVEIVAEMFSTSKDVERAIYLCCGDNKEFRRAMQADAESIIKEASKSLRRTVH